MAITTVIFDLDEVLVDFLGGAMAVHNLGKGQPRLQWNLGLDEATFWTPIHALGEEWWANLRPFSWFYQVLELASKGRDWYVVTRPQNTVDSYTGKIKWLSKHFSTNLYRCTVTQKPKSLFATPQHLLIDDHVENVTQFRARGGYAILFPSRVNHLWPLFNDPIPYLEAELEMLACT